MKEQIKTPQKELHEMEISNLSDAEFKTLVIRMFKEPREDLSSIEKTKSEMIALNFNVSGYILFVFFFC